MEFWGVHFLLRFISRLMNEWDGKGINTPGACLLY